MNSAISASCGMVVVVKLSSRHDMWTEITRQKYVREEQRHASDLTVTVHAGRKRAFKKRQRLAKQRAQAIHLVFEVPEKHCNSSLATYTKMQI
jgi:hypothetical protein